MNIRNYTQQERICASSRLSLPNKVNSSMDVWNKLANNCNARVTFVPGVERPIGPLGNWIQTITITVEGDYDNPKCKELFDALQAKSSDRLKKLYDSDFSNVGESDGSEALDKYSNAESTNQFTTQRRAIAVTSSNTGALLKRAFLFLEDSDWSSANDYCETVLDMNPECAEAYLGKLMAELHVCKQEDLKNCEQPFNDLKSYQKAMRFGDNILQSVLSGYVDHINARNENRRKNEIYDAAKKQMIGDQITNYQQAINQFKTIPDWKDSGAQIAACRSKIASIKAREEFERKEAEERKRKEEESRAKKSKILVMIAIVIICAVAFLIVLNSVIIPNNKYNNAVALLDAGKYTDAMVAFEALEGYKDSEEKLFMSQMGKLKLAGVGDYIFFGAYEQDDDVSNGKENIEWLVLAKEDNRILAISKYALDSRDFCNQYYGATWETSDIREWLNSAFLNDAFTDAEKAFVPVVTVEVHKNPKFNSNSESDTRDRVFLLSIEEVQKYFVSDAERICQPTEYAKTRGRRTGSEDTDWWLRTQGIRTPERNNNYISLVTSDGSINFSGIQATGDATFTGEYCIRPALWIDLTAVKP